MANNTEHQKFTQKNHFWTNAEISRSQPKTSSFGSRLRSKSIVIFLTPSRFNFFFTVPGRGPSGFDFRNNAEISPETSCSATSFLRNWDSILEKKRANLRSISEPARLRQPPPRSTGAAHARGRAQSIREERRIAAPPVLFALLWVRLLPALYGPFCGPLRPFGGCPWGVTPPARECLPPAPPDTRRRG